jgi:GNAT superfamily N-acetyltransferase
MTNGDHGSVHGAITVTDQWSDDLLREVSAFYSARPQKGPWSGRWDTSLSYFRWKCAACPIRPSVIAYAAAEGCIVGAIILTFKHFRDDDRRLLAAELGDMYIHPDHRGEGLFARLVEAATAKGQEAGAELIFCIPNSAGADALVRSGRFFVSPEAEHLTLLLPLRPFALMATRKPIFRLLGFLDNVWTLLIRIALRLPHGRLAGDAANLRLDMRDGYLDYRVHRHPNSESYIGLPQTASNNLDQTWVKEVRYAGLPAVIVGRIYANQHGLYLTQVDETIRYAVGRNAAFAALWVPARAASWFRWRPFVRMQRKNILCAHGTGAHIVSQLHGLRLEMLDSDKI